MTLKNHDNGTDRDMTDEEIVAHKANIKQMLLDQHAQIEVQAAKAAAREAVLEKLGLTADEAAALFG